MPYRYTGRASSFYLQGSDKEYKRGDIVPISKQDALNMIEQGNLHSFELVDEKIDLEDVVTKPASTADKKEGSK